MGNKHSTILLILCLVVSLGQAQVNVSAAFDSTSMLIGDHTDLHLRADYPSNVTVFYPDLSGADFGGLEILNIGPIDTISTGNRIQAIQNITVTAFDSGFYAIPGLAFTVNRSGQDATITYSNSVGIGVTTVAIDTARIAPIKTIIKEPLKFQDIVPYLVIFGAIFAVALAGFFLYQYVQASKEPKETGPVYIPPAHEIALDKLYRLKNAQLWQKGLIKEYYSRVSYILREYIENRYQKPALESITEEIIDSLKDDVPEMALLTNLRQNLQLADLVKFAKARPGTDQHAKLLEDAEQFVLETKKEPLTEPEEATSDTPNDSEEKTANE